MALKNRPDVSIMILESKSRRTRATHKKLGIHKEQIKSFGKVYYNNKTKKSEVQSEL